MFDSLLAELKLSVAEIIELVGVALVIGIGLFLLRWGSRKIKQGLEASEKQQYQNWKKKYGGKFNQ